MQFHKPAGLWIPSLVVALALVAGALVWSMPTIAQDENEPAAQACESSSVDRTVNLFAKRINKNRIGYALGWKAKPKVPGPTIEMAEGECIAVTLRNKTTKKASLHAHGVNYTTASDGTKLNNSCVSPGGKRTYIWDAHTKSTRPDGTIEPGSAGYWNYHDHCRRGEHGTSGIYKGLVGALIVRSPDDPEPAGDPCVLVMIGFTFNYKRAPNTPLCEANLGERAEFVVITHGDLFHTFHLHGHRWADTRTGSLANMTDDTPVIDNKTTGPADSFGFQIIAGERTGPGAWMYHCHVQNHSDLGMAGIFLVRNADGSMPPGAQEALDHFKKHH